MSLTFGDQPAFFLALGNMDGLEAFSGKRGLTASNKILKGNQMRKTIAAVSVGLLMVAGQAVAAGNNTAVARVGDRVGASADASNEFAGIPIAVLLIGGAVLATAIVVATDDDSDSD